MRSALDRRSFLWCAVAVPAALAPLLHVLPAWLTLMLVLLWGMATALGARGWLMPLWLRLPLTLVAAVIALGAFGFRFGRDTGAALLATMLVLKLLELRRVRDARSVLGFSLFACVAAFLLDQGPEMLALALIGALVLLAALAEIADREAGADRRVRILARLRTAGTLALLSLPLALAGFFLFPRLAEPLWGVPAKAADARTGLGGEMSPGDIAALYIDDTPVLRVDFDGEVPPSSALYWRGPVLTRFDGRAWSRTSFYSDNLPPPSPNAIGERIVYTVTQEPTDRRYVLALDMALEAPRDTRFDWNRTLLSRDRIDAVTRHRFVSSLDYRYGMPLQRTLASWLTELPQGFNPRALALAAELRQRHRDPRDYIAAVLARFNASFVYTLTPQLLGRDSVDEFLFDTQAGYCEHFASAFAFMTRAAGIPTRIVTGYQGGYLNPMGGHWVVRQSDAHAWTEVWLEDAGWIRVDPTAAVAPERIESGAQGFPGADPVPAWWLPLRNAGDWLMRGWSDLMLGFDAERQANLLDRIGMDGEDWRQLGLAFVAVTGIALALTLWLVLRQRDAAVEPLVAAYRRFVRRLGAAGARKRADEGPAAFAVRAAAALPADAAAIAALTARYVRWRYAGADLDAAAAAALTRDLQRYRPRGRRNRKTGASA